MNKKRLDINRFEYHDNVSVDFTQDTQKKETIIYYDYYLYNTNTEIETIEKPVRLIIKGWTKIAAYDENNAFLCHLESCNYFIHEVLNMEQHDNYVLLYIEGEINEEDFIGFVKYTDASVSLEEINMLNRKNVFFNINQIENLNREKTFFAIIPEVTTKEELFTSLKKQLLFRNSISFPSTWKGLAETLSDIYWLGRSFYVIIHNDLSRMFQDDLNAYIDVIRQCQQRTLRVFFVIDSNTYRNYYNPRRSVNDQGTESPD